MCSGPCFAIQRDDECYLDKKKRNYRSRDRDDVGVELDTEFEKDIELKRVEWKNEGAGEAENG